MPRAKPEDVGMSSERLARIGAALKEDIDRGLTLGGVIARRGKLVALDAYDWRDKAAGVPMTTDTIFNIASMTKPMTTVGALMLYEQGRLLMDDPLSKYFPKFAEMRVAARDDQGEPTGDTVPAQRKITIQDLPASHIRPDLWRPRLDAGAQAISRGKRGDHKGHERRAVRRQAGVPATAASAGRRWD
jgi:CubicO group peptidase (beta-lactamase class C family)